MANKRVHNVPLPVRWHTELRRYRRLIRRKRSDFWHWSTDSDSSSPWHLWRSTPFTGRATQAASPHVTATDFRQFFVDKIAGVRASTDGARNLVIQPTPGAVLDVFNIVQSIFGKNP